jgi:hypothetical protein
MPTCILAGSGETMEAARVHRRLSKIAVSTPLHGFDQWSMSVIGIFRQLHGKALKGKSPN